MTRFRKKPVVIEAFRLGDAIPDWARGRRDIAFLSAGATIHTLEGAMRANPGDWIIRGVKDELYPCKPDIFEATYEPAE
jgi:hypothetical protein